MKLWQAFILTLFISFFAWRSMDYKKVKERAKDSMFITANGITIEIEKQEGISGKVK